MNPCLTTSIRAGSAAGVAFWLVESCSFGARLWLNENGADGPVGPAPQALWDADDGWARLTVGGRAGEFVTTDGLINQLGLHGFTVSPRSTEAIAQLRDRVTRTFGDVEMLGLRGPVGGTLILALPDGRNVTLPAPLDHPDHRHRWGHRDDVVLDPGAIETARTLVRCAWSRRWGADEEMLSQALAHNFLAHCGSEFSLTANSLCDWFLFDRDLTTELTSAQLQRLSRSAVGDERLVAIQEHD